jgi:hypothetical protein
MGDLEDLDYTDEDWADFQEALHMLAPARAVYERMGAFEAKLRTTLGHVVMVLRLELNEASALSTRSGAQLLALSTLNSAELHSLLSSLVPEHQRYAYVAPSRHGHPLTHSGPPPLLVDARAAVLEFSKACQTSLQSTILSPLHKHLSTYASSPMWSAPGDPKMTRVGHDLQVPSFSLSPSDTVQRVAEGLLNLPRLFEVYADDDALAFSLLSLETGEGLTTATVVHGHEGDGCLYLFKILVINGEERPCKQGNFECQCLSITVDGFNHGTFQEATLALGIFADSNEGHHVLQEAILSYHTPSQLHFLFLEGYQALPLWNTFRDDQLRLTYFMTTLSRAWTPWTSPLSASPNI